MYEVYDGILGFVVVVSIGSRSRINGIGELGESAFGEAGKVGGRHDGILD